MVFQRSMVHCTNDNHQVPRTIGRRNLILPKPITMTMTTAAKRVHLSDLHTEHMLWLNALAFYKEEIGILEKRLEHVAKRNTQREVLAELEHFQNQYIREREVIDELRHDVKQHENVLEKEVKDHPIAVDHRLFVDHTDLRERMETFERLYKDLKKELFRWLEDRM